jgi:hypothetical protein
MKVRTPSSTIVKLDWELGDTNGQWNEACIYALETFGLPGGKYKTELTADWMIFNFEDSRDAIMFAMRWS